MGLNQCLTHSGHGTELLLFAVVLLCGCRCVFPPSPCDSGRAAVGLKSVSGNEEGLHGFLWQEPVTGLAWSSPEEGILRRRAMFRSVLCVHVTHGDGSGD